MEYDSVYESKIVGEECRMKLVRADGGEQVQTAGGASSGVT